MQAERMGNWWVAVVAHFLSVEINGLGNCLEQSKLYTLTAFVMLKCCCGGYSAGVGYTFRETVGLLYGANTAYGTGANIKLLVANHETEFKILTFSPFRNNTVNVSQLRTVIQFK
jgi:hypothetical protein